MIKELKITMKLLFNWFTKSRPNLNQDGYKEKIQNEINFYKDCDNVHELPDIFHYWSNKYLLPKLKPFGFTNPDDFFVFHCKKYCQDNPALKIIRITSIGSGNGELEVSIAVNLAKENMTNFVIECVDINQYMLERTLTLAKEKEVEQYIKINQADFNKWLPKKKNSYDIVIANQSLHHVLELEHLFDSIYKGLKKQGIFVTSDMIGRNGHMRWPEALEVLKSFWAELPDNYKFNQLLKREEKQYINHDCSTEGFEGIRAQDILKLLTKKFHFKLFIPFANIVMVFIDRPFGHNFDVNNPRDLEFIDRVHAKDEELMLNGMLKPTQMLAVMSKNHRTETKLLNPKLTPKYCIRQTD